MREQIKIKKQKSNKNISQSKTKKTTHKKAEQKSQKQQSYGKQLSNQSLFHNFTKSIQLHFSTFIQVIQQINISSCIDSHSLSLSIPRLLSLLQCQFNIFTKDKFIKFYLQSGCVWLSIPKILNNNENSIKSVNLYGNSNNLNNNNFYIDKQDYYENNVIKLMLLKDKELIDVIMGQEQPQSQQENDEIDQNDQDNQEDNDNQDNDDIENQHYYQKNKQKKNNNKIKDQGNNYNNNNKCRRLKQRKIKNVIQKVLKWRQLYAGIQSNQQNQKHSSPSTRIPLEQGAKIVKISKKTLDDYLSQIKKGKKYGFNFNDHKNQKIGVLRQFIRKMERKK